MKSVLFIFLIALVQPLIAQDKDICGITDDEIKAVYANMRTNLKALKKAGKIDTTRWAEMHSSNSKTSGDMQQQFQYTSIRFAWPMKPRYPETYDYYYIVNFIDLDTTGVNCVKDYMGGRRTYNGHHGTDIAVGPYHWKRKREASVYAVAAAPGIIIEKRDGSVDENCSFDNGNGPSNRVVLLHDDGSTASFYMHLANGSLIDRELGARVETGDFLGVVASSGNSTGPHLHFQAGTGFKDIEEDDGEFVDPWAGPSNYTTNVSLWLDQKPYREPAVIGMETHLGTTMDWYSSGCDAEISLGTLQNNFSASQTVGMRAFFRDWTDGSTASAGIIRPDGSKQAAWINIANACTFEKISCEQSYYDPCTMNFIELSFTVPASPLAGTWIFWVYFNGKTYHHYFTVNCVQDLTIASGQTGQKGHKVSRNITSTAIITSATTNIIQFHADNSVVLQPGFTAIQGSTFTATNKGCTNNKVN